MLVASFILLTNDEKKGLFFTKVYERFFMQAEQDRQSASARTPLILCYHAITAEPAPLSDFCFLPLSHFRAQMRFLSLVAANVIEFNEALERMRDKSLPRRTVVVTFDDGFKKALSR